VSFSIVSPEDVLTKEELLSLFVYAGAEDQDSKPEIKFPNQPRRRHCDEWKLHRRYKSEGINLMDDDLRATLLQTGHAFLIGTKIFSKGKHAWRVHIESLSGQQWIFIGICAVSARSKLKKLSFDDPTAYGFSSTNQRYFGGVQRRYRLRHSPTPIDWRIGHPVDVLLDLDEGSLSFCNPITKASWQLAPLPKGEKWVPHFNLHTAGNKFRVETIQVQDYGVRV